eukprot:CAMPEP_0113636848 /NCGR_PEP_ID=MMETSP0017_2-20120614/19252_1 /TAXON_ID=2856 /ORGANISM="Cylindrotheca closterium" /LENGTH=666 /DNA_ID=CAMNT_0000547777 /DNA_START=9 /DNA_END=2009 /DNA_ORIENTATION=- /assembly_acc=CAM_ASM_000147
MEIGKDDTKADPDDWVAFDAAEDVQFDAQWDQASPSPQPDSSEPQPGDLQQWQPQQPQEPQDMSTPEPSDADPPFDPYSDVALKKTVSAERTGSAMTALTHPETPPRRQKKHAIDYGAEVPMPNMVAKNILSDTDSNSEDPEQPSFGGDKDKSKSTADRKPSRRNCVFHLILAFLLLAIAGALGFIVYMHLFHEVETEAPSTEPTLAPTPLQSSPPTLRPTSRPTVDTASPTMFITPAPTTRPPTSPPSRSPSRVPSAAPTNRPSDAPSMQPTNTKDELRDLLTKITDGQTIQAINLPGTPQQKAYEWVHKDPAYNEFKERRIVQRFVMAVLHYSSVRSETSKEAMATWMDYGTNECTWFTSWYNNRIACGSDNVFKTLALRNVALTGTIPSELALLTHLNTLVLSDNMLTGSLPKEFGQWASLVTLDVHSNFLTGRIPFFTNAPNLREISLGSNRLSGIVPTSIANLNLTSLDLAENNVQGIIPPALCSTPEQNSQLELMTVDCDLVTCFCCTQCGANRTRAPVLAPFTPPPSPAPTPRPTEGPTSCVSNVEVSKGCYKVGDPVEVSFTNCNPRAGDWLGLYDAESPEQFLMDPLLWHWSCGSKSCSGSPIQGGSTLDGSAEGQAFWPLNRGNYKVYLIRNGANFPYQSVAGSGEFRVAQRICPD